MSFSRGPKEPVEEVETKIWLCNNGECETWMRQSFSFDKEPKCPICESEMTEDLKKLPKLS